jgi:hypothetical protein
VSDGPHQEPPVTADETRDISLPPLPDRPPASMPKEWAALRPQASSVDAPTTAVPKDARPPAAPAVGPQEGPGTSREESAEAEERRVARQRTDELVRTTDGTARERTLAFPSPEMRHRPIEPVRVGATPRRWPWVLMALVPVVVIVASTIAWLILLRGV